MDERLPTAPLASLRGGDLTTVRAWLGAPRLVEFDDDELLLGYADRGGQVVSDAIVVQDGIVVSVAPGLHGVPFGGDPWFAAPIERLVTQLGPLQAMLPLPAGHELRFVGRRVYVHEGRVVRSVLTADLGGHGVWLLPERSRFTTAS